MQKAITGLIVVVGIIHVLPVIGVLGADRLSMLYGISFAEPNLSILMRHRAVLFGILGSFLIYAAFRPALRALAFVAGFVSVVSFIAIAWSVGGFNDAIRNLVVGDLVALVCLLMVLIFYVIQRRKS